MLVFRIFENKRFPSFLPISLIFSAILWICFAVRIYSYYMIYIPLFHFCLYLFPLYCYDHTALFWSNIVLIEIIFLFLVSVKYFFIWVSLFPIIYLLIGILIVDNFNFFLIYSKIWLEFFVSSAKLHLSLSSFSIVR